MESVTYIAVPQQTFDKILSDLAELKRLNSKNQKEGSIPAKEWLSRKEYMEHCGIRTTKLYELINRGIVRTRKVGRRLYIHSSSIDRYFALAGK